MTYDPSAPSAESPTPAQIADVESRRSVILKGLREMAEHGQAEPSRSLFAQMETAVLVDIPRLLAEIQRRRASPSLETREATAEPVAPLRCGNCGFEPNHPAAQLGEICVKCGCDGYRLRPREQQSGSLVLAAAEWLIGAEGRARALGYTSAVDLSDALKATQQSEPSE